MLLYVFAPLLDLNFLISILLSPLLFRFSLIVAKLHQKGLSAQLLNHICTKLVHLYFEGIP
uniref:Transmembrane protein n=1 Tax=Medicago truncatula TaxID=3880 RepID=I3SPT8_MEDTR|nr:unknown [Medicago truncatula]